MFENAMTINHPEPVRDPAIRMVSDGQSLALAMAYVPMQCLKNAYPLEQALYAGTLFPELDKPFLGVKGGDCYGG